VRGLSRAHPGGATFEASGGLGELPVFGDLLYASVAIGPRCIFATTFHMAEQ
jgi:hypothetical protein